MGEGWTDLPDTILMTPNSTANYAEVSLVPLPAASNGNETVTFSSLAPSGLTVAYFHNSLVVSTTDVMGQVYTPVEVYASPSVAPNTYTIQIVASYGTNSSTLSVSVEVVKYLVVIPNNQNRFSPSNLTVGLNSTVYWLNLDTDNFYNVVFSSGSSARSPQIAPFGVYAYTFTSVGTYSYYTTYVAFMTGTVIVTENG